MARQLRILEIVTVPFFAPRGTSFSALERTKALSRLGHKLDVLTYHLGDPVEIPNVNIHRIRPVPFVHSIPMGPSLKKLILDTLLAAKTFWWLLFRKYDLVHVHEESAYWASLFRPLTKAPILYDMHSSLVEQLSNFGYSRNGFIQKVFGFLEKLALKSARGIIVICPELKNLVQRQVTGKPIRLIENLPVGWDTPACTHEQVERIRSEHDLAGKQVLLYTGTFGHNQGLELLLDALKLAADSHPDLRAVLVGGSDKDLDRVREYAVSHQLTQYVIFTGRLPHTEMAAYMELADILVSPRTEGTNTPLKIYAYLASGRPIVATDLHTHTQVLDDQVAELVEPTVEGFCRAICRLLNDPDRRRELGENGVRLAKSRYGIDRYMRQLQEILDEVCPPGKEAG